MRRKPCWSIRTGVGSSPTGWRSNCCTPSGPSSSSTTPRSTSSTRVTAQPAQAVGERPPAHRPRAARADRPGPDRREAEPGVAAGWRPRQGLSARRERRDRGAADGGCALAVARAAALGARRLGARRRPALVRRPPGAPRRLRRPRADGPSRGAAGLRFGDGVFPRGTGGHHQRGPPRRRQARRGGRSGRGRHAGPERARRRRRLRRRGGAPRDDGGRLHRARRHGGARPPAGRRFPNRHASRNWPPRLGPLPPPRAMTATPLRVLLAEDHTLVRKGIRAVLRQVGWIDVIAEAADGREALDLARRHGPDVVVMDIAMPGLNGLEATARITKESPRTRVLILSMHATEEYVAQALRAGASGYLLKGADVPEFELALKAVARGETYLTPTVSKHVVDEYLRRVGEPGVLDLLTPRQREILQLVAEGCSSKEIAQQLHLTVKTVETRPRP